MKHNWEEHIKNSLGSYQQVPSNDLWPEIERKLDKRDKKRPVIIPLWWKSGAIVATAASLALIILLNPAHDLADNASAQIDQDTEKWDEKSSTFSEPNQMGKTGEQADEFLADNNQKSENQSFASSNTTESTQITTKGRAGINDNLPASQGTSSRARAEKASVAAADERNTDPISPKATISGSTGPVASTTTDRSSATKVSITTSIATADQKDNSPTEIVEKLEEPVTSLIADQEVAAPLIDEPENKAWSIIPVAGPVYYNSLTQGSVFDPSFSDNSRQGDITFSYGLRANLAFDSRITLRAGINSVAMGYATQDIEIATGPAAFGLSSVNYVDDRNIISVFDKGTVPVNPDPSNPYSQLNLKSTTGETSIRANLNYLEFPVELSYALIDQQVKLSLISGVSGLLLNNNEVSVSDGQNRYVLGSLNNLNQFSFSTNLGFGLSYTVFKGLNLQLEPTFKYQLGTFKDANVAFTPYQLVLLSGLQFQF